MKKLLLLAGVGAVLSGTGCNTHHEESESETKFLVTSAVQMDTAITRQYVCQVKSISHIELRALERGYLKKIFVDEGKFVKEGQPLFQIMPNLYQAEFQKAQAEANYAEIEYKNTKRLADSNVVAPNELAMAKAKLNKAQAEMSLAEVHLKFTEIRAPFDGIIDRFHVRLGSLVGEGDLLTTLSDNRQLWVYFNVPEAEYLDYASHLKKDSVIPVKLLMANGEVFDQPGAVKTIEADFDNETGNIAFRATFPNPAGILRHGETGNILMRIPLANAIIIPQKATFEIMDKKYVYVVTKDNHVQLRLVTIGAEMPDLYVIKEGVAAGERILLEGVRRVQNNDVIKYDYQEPKTVMSKLQLPSE